MTEKRKQTQENILDELVKAMERSGMTKDKAGQRDSYSLKLAHCVLTITPVIERKRLKTVRANIEFPWIGVFADTGPNQPPFKRSYSLPVGPGTLTPAVYVERAVSAATDVNDEFVSIAQKIGLIIRLRMGLDQVRVLCDGR